MLIMNETWGYLDELVDGPEGVQLGERPDRSFDFVQLFVKDFAELRSMIPAALGGVKHDGLLWISYPKRSSSVETALSGDVVWEPIAKMG